MDIKKPFKEEEEEEKKSDGGKMELLTPLFHLEMIVICDA